MIQQTNFLGSHQVVAGATAPETVGAQNKSGSASTVIVASAISGLAFLLFSSALLVLRRQQRRRNVSKGINFILECAEAETSSDEEDHHHPTQGSICDAVGPSSLTCTSSNTTDSWVYPSSSSSLPSDDDEEPSSPPIVRQYKAISPYRTLFQPPDFQDDPSAANSPLSTTNSSGNKEGEDQPSSLAAADNLACSSPQAESQSFPSLNEDDHPYSSPNAWETAEDQLQQQKLPDPLDDALIFSDFDDDDDIFAGLIRNRNEGQSKKLDGQSILLDLQGLQLNNYFVRKTLKPIRRKRKKSLHPAALVRPKDVFVTLESIQEETSNCEEEDALDKLKATATGHASSRGRRVTRAPSPGLRATSPPKRDASRHGALMGDPEKVIVTPTKFHSAGPNSGTRQPFATLSSPTNLSSPNAQVIPSSLFSDRSAAKAAFVEAQQKSPKEIVIKESPTTEPISGGRIRFKPAGDHGDNRPVLSNVQIGAEAARHISGNVFSPVLAPVVLQKDKDNQCEPGGNTRSFSLIQTSNNESADSPSRSPPGHFPTEVTSPRALESDSGSSDEDENAQTMQTTYDPRSLGVIPLAYGSEPHSPRAAPLGKEISELRPMIRTRPNADLALSPTRKEAIFLPQAKSPPSLLSKSGYYSDDAEGDSELLMDPTQQEMASVDSIPSNRYCPVQSYGSHQGEGDPAIVFEEPAPPNVGVSAKLKRIRKMGNDSLQKTKAPSPIPEESSLDDKIMSSGSI